MDEKKQATERNVSAHVAMVLVDVSLLDTKKDAELTSFCQFHKSDQKNTCRHRKSLHQDIVCLFNKFECLKNVKTFQSPKRVP
jgi:hypothetical protein